MNSASLAQSAYSKAAAIAPSGQDIEYRAFAEVTRRLTAYGAGPDANFPKLAEAVHLNQRLWRILASDIADERNELPAGLRAQLYYLYEFTAQHSRKVLSGEAKASVLIEVNTAVMRGLRGTRPDGGGGAE